MALAPLLLAAAPSGALIRGSTATTVIGGVLKIDGSLNASSAVAVSGAGAIGGYLGAKLSLASLKGKPVVLYFYPKADTPG